jgi:hypothetical protein
MPAVLPVVRTGTPRDGGHKQKRTLGWLSNNSKVACPACKASTDLDNADLRRDIERDRKEVSRFYAVSENGTRYEVIEWDGGFVFHEIDGQRQHYPDHKEWTLLNGMGVICIDDV